MAEGFINIEVESDPDILRQGVYEAIQEQFEEWDPAKAELDKFIIDGCSLMAADLGDVAGVVPEEILRQFGETIYKIPALSAEPATAKITIKVKDTAGYPTIVAGTKVTFTKPDGNKIAFRVQKDVEVPVGVSEIKKVGTQVKQGEPLMMIHYNDESKLEQALEYFKNAYRLAPKRPTPPPLVVERVA